MKIKDLKPLLVLAGLLGAAAPLVAEGPYRTAVNPALLYWQLMPNLPTTDPAHRNLLDNYQIAPLDESYRVFAASWDSKFRILRRAVDVRQPCDWGIDLTDGPETLLPHLGHAKTFAKAAAFRTRLFLANGQEAEAVQDLLAAVVFARRLGDDSTLIAALVQFAIEGIVFNSVAENFHSFSADGLDRLVAGIDAGPAGCTISQSVGTGERQFVTWYGRKIEEIRAAHPGDEARVMADIRKLLGGIVGEEEPAAAAVVDKFITAANGSSQRMLDLVRALDPYYDEMQAITRLPYAEFPAANQAFFEKIGNSNNPFVGALFPALQKARNKEFRIQARRNMLKAAAAYRRHGEAGLKAVNDPFGSGPFGFRRFEVQAMDRGFELRSALSLETEFPEATVFVEKDGAPFRVSGPNIGKPFEKN